MNGWVAMMTATFAVLVICKEGIEGNHRQRGKRGDDPAAAVHGDEV